MQIVVGIITISDRASGGQYQDLGGPAVKAAAENHGWDVLAEAIVPDDKKRIQETIRSFSAQGCGSNPDDWWYGSSRARRYPGSDPRDHARGDTRLW